MDRRNGTARRGRHSGITFDQFTLRVLYSPVSTQEPLLKSEWGDAFLFDGADYTAHGLLVGGIDASPEQCATWAASWFEQQLRRPIIRREWDRPADGAARLLPAQTRDLAVTEWWFSDTEERLWTTSSLVWAWLTKTAPSRQIEERPDRTTGPKEEG